MISLKHIVESEGMNGQYYDLGRDFSNFNRTIDGTFEQIKEKFEAAIGSKLNGKRIRAKASRGYKQYVKDYEFDVSKITLDDYYDNYVVVAHDNTTPKAKEYFLKPGFKIQVLGAATGQPSPQKGDRPDNKLKHDSNVPVNPGAAQSQPMAPAGNTTSEIKEGGNVGTGHYDAYSMDSIAQDIKGWLPRILRKPDTALRDFIKGLGWLKNLDHGQSIALFDIKLPFKELRGKPTKDELIKLVHSADKFGTIDTTFSIKNIKPDEKNGEILVRIKKTMVDKSAR